MRATRWNTHPFITTLVLLLLVSQGCRKGSVTEPDDLSDEVLKDATGAPIRTQEDLSIVAGLTMDGNGVPVIPFAAPPATPLFYARDGKPILAPDGHQVSAAEFSAATGSIDVSCLTSGTRIEIDAAGLIPGGLYRVWILKFKAPGFSIGPPPDFSNLTGEGALGPDDRSENTFTASASGEGRITQIHPAGALSETLPAPPFANAPAGPCLLTDEFEWHVIGAFQQPDQPAGPGVGPPALFPGTAVEQFVGIFRSRG